MPNSSSGNFNSSGQVMGATAPTTAGNNNANSILDEVSVAEADKDASGEGKFCEIQ